MNDSKNTLVETKKPASLLAILFLIAMIPFGISFQNIIGGMVMVYLLYTYMKSKNKLDLVNPNLKLAIFSSLFLVGAVLLGTILNSKNHAKAGSVLGYVCGYSYWIFLPLIAVLSTHRLSVFQAQKIIRFIAVMGIAWGGICASQYFFGWRIAGASIVPDIPRPRGFYSHPLTMAYGYLWLWPLSSYLIFKKGSKPIYWLFFMASLFVIFSTASRTIQLLSVISFYLSIRIYATGLIRKLFTLGILVLTLVIGITENPISKRFYETFSEHNKNRYSQFFDDRVAFWQAHFEMIKERPVLGHGIRLDTAYRTPYYEAIGLNDLRNKYEAHNTYIQILANGGIIAFLSFMIYMLALWREARDLQRLKGGMLFLQTIGFFLVAILTQNSFQDAENRMALAVFASLVFLWPRTAPPPLKSTISDDL